jgi:RNA polymerase sigma factor (sigma-70 family)
MQITIGNTLTQKVHIADIVGEYGTKLKNFIRKRVSSEEDTEDILQDVFYRLVEADSLMKPIEQLSGWLYAVTRNRITDWYRKKGSELLNYSKSADSDDDLFFEIGDLLVSQDDSAESEYLKSMVWDELEKALDELPEEQRLVFEMNELQGVSFKEIAQTTGVSENTLISRKRYAVLHLRERLKFLYDELINF